MKTPHEKLDAWCLAERGRAALLAKRLMRSPATVSLWRKTSVPSVALWSRLDRLTGGAVTAEDWMRDLRANDGRAS